MDAFAHLRIKKGRVNITESGAGVKIEIMGLMINESIMVEIGECSRIDITPLRLVGAKRDGDQN